MKRIAPVVLASILALLLAACGSAASHTSTSSPASTSTNEAKGEEPLVLIVVGFAGDANGSNAISYRSDYNWHDLAFTSDKGVSAYYNNQSNGDFTWTPAHETSAFEVDGNTCAADTADDGIVHVTLPRGHGHWFKQEEESDTMSTTSGTYTYDASNDQLSSNDADFNACMLEALKAADAYVDFSSYDKNKDGALEKNELGVGLIVAGYDIDGPWMTLLDDNEYPRMQAHANAFSSDSASSQNIIIPDDTVVMGESIISVPVAHEDDLTVDPSLIQVTPNSLSTLTHELGHYLGLADYYDTSYNSEAAWADWTPGPLSVMDTGAVLPVTNSEGRHEYVASSFDPFSLIDLSWLTADTVNASGTYELRAAGAAGGKNVLRVNTNTQGEYFLIENRQATGQDAGLVGYYENEPVGGIVVWHVDENQYKKAQEDNEVNLPVHRPSLTVQYLLAKTGPDTTIHTLNFAESIEPDTLTAFWTASNAQKRFAELGTDSFELWTYGPGAKADNTKDRRYCGIKLRFPDESADIMHVEIELP